MKSLIRIALAVTIVCAAAVFATTVSAQTIYVAKCAGAATCDERAQFKSIQAAVNAAQPGTTIEILDTATYNEQVTIDGREVTPWGIAPYNVIGGKTNITLMYKVNPANPLSRPTIQYRDITNTSPSSTSQASLQGELPGQAGNFEANGALRILHAKYITIDGIIVDGVSAFPFGANKILGDDPLWHGNAAITVTVSGNIIIRNSHMKNAYFGIYVKDKNPGGVFANKNPQDLDFTVPLSAFGKVGNHLIEHNRIFDNSVGLFFESAYDLGSTVRYNLIFNNKRRGTMPSGVDKANEQNGGAFLFKDMYLTPLAIYNNTLHNNSGNFQGQWQIGGQHLIFNNIFGHSNPSENPSPYMTIDDKFPYRMHSNLAASTEISYISMTETSPDFLVPDWTNQYVKDSIMNKGWTSAGIRNNDGQIADLGAIPSTGKQQTTLARIRPLEPVMIANGQAKVTVRLDRYEGAIVDSKVSFLRWIAPIPENAASWPGGMTDIVPVPAASIRSITPPTGTVNYGTTSFTFPVTGTVPKYGFFEMVLSGKDEATGMDVTSDVAFLPYRELMYTMNVSVHERGTTGSAGKTTTVTAGDTVRLYVTASQRNPTTGALTPFTQTLDEVSYELTSDPMATMLCNGNCPPNATNLRPLTEDNTGVAGTGKSYEVIFWKTGTETISSAGAYYMGTGANRTGLSFYGISDPIEVKPKDGNISVKEVERLIVGTDTAGDAMVTPAVRLTAMFSAGPNPVGKSAKKVNFYRQGNPIEGADLMIYDLNGNVVRKNIRIDDKLSTSSARRVVGSWDLKDRRGCQVAEGTYLVNGTITVNGKKERVSLMVGVR